MDITRSQIRSRCRCLLLCLLLAGCGPKWVNPTLAPGEADARLDHDSRMCQEYVDHSIPDTNTNEDRVVSGRYYVDTMQEYDIGARRDELFARCLEARGWHQD